MGKMRRRMKIQKRRRRRQRERKRRETQGKVRMRNLKRNGTVRIVTLRSWMKTMTGRRKKDLKNRFVFCCL